MTELLQELHQVSGPFDREKVADACAGLGAFGRATRDLFERGLVPPDVLMGMTLTLLGKQPREERLPDDDRASPIEGGVWVREQVTIHRPCRIDEPWTILGGTAQRFVRKGRRYGVTVAQTLDADGRVIVSNCTTGLLSYRADAALADAVEGQRADELAVPVPDSAGAIAFAVAVAPGTSLSDHAEMTLELMQRRDGRHSLNPIHSDPERARRAGLTAPIAGGSHVTAFALELLMREWGPDVLLHGAHLDVQWKSPTYAGDRIEPNVTVASATDDFVTFAIAVEPAKLRGTIVVPRRGR